MDATIKAMDDGRFVIRLANGNSVSFLPLEAHGTIQAWHKGGVLAYQDVCADASSVWSALRSATEGATNA